MTQLSTATAMGVLLCQGYFSTSLLNAKFRRWRLELANNTLSGHASLHGLFTRMESNEFVAHSVGNIFADALIVQVTLSCQKCAYDILLDAVLEVLVLVFWAQL